MKLINSRIDSKSCRFFNEKSAQSTVSIHKYKLQKDCSCTIEHTFLSKLNYNLNFANF